MGRRESDAVKNITGDKPVFLFFYNSITNRFMEFDLKKFTSTLKERPAMILGVDTGKFLAYQCFLEGFLLGLQVGTNDEIMYRFGRFVNKKLINYDSSSVVWSFTFNRKYADYSDAQKINELIILMEEFSDAEDQIS